MATGAARCYGAASQQRRSPWNLRQYPPPGRRLVNGQVLVVRRWDAGTGTGLAEPFEFSLSWNLSLRTAPVLPAAMPAEAIQL